MSSFKSLILQVLEYDLKPECLVILAEEEMVFIDLGFFICIFQPFIVHASFHTPLCFQYYPLSASKGWPVFQPPYLHSIHASAITCLSEVCSLHPDLLARLETHSPGPPSGSYVLPSQVHSVLCLFAFFCFSSTDLSSEAVAC